MATTSFHEEIPTKRHDLSRLIANPPVTNQTLVPTTVALTELARLCVHLLECAPVDETDGSIVYHKGEILRRLSANATTAKDAVNSFPLGAMIAEGIANGLEAAGATGRTAYNPIRETGVFVG